MKNLDRIILQEITTRSTFQEYNKDPVLDPSRVSYLCTHMPEDGLVGDSGSVHALMRGLRGPMLCFGCQEPGHVITNCPHLAEITSTPGATLTYNRPSAHPQRTNASAQEMAHAMDANQRLEEASAAEHHVDINTQRLLLLSDHVDFACAHAPREAAAGRSAGAVYTVLLPPVSPRKHKVMSGHDDVTEMAGAMEVARRCGIVADATQALNANWGKIHNPWEHAWPHQFKRWGEGQ